MNCPYCDFTDTRMKLHRHLGEAHLDRVTTEHDDETGKMKYVIGCPLCGLKYQHAVKPRYTDLRFLEEYRAEIALVAFDQLLYHLEEKHPNEAGLTPASDVSPESSSTPAH